MKKQTFVLFIGFIAAILSACSLTNIQQTTSTSVIDSTTDPTQTLTMENYFPLRQGAFWIYEGPIRWIKSNSNEVVEETIQWKMEVVRVIQRGDTTGFEMLGAPSDVAWYDENKERSSYAYIFVGGKIYRTSVDVLARMEDENDTLQGLVNESGVFINIPLMDGQKICDAEVITRSDGWYCWHVYSSEDAKPLTISGIKSTSGSEEFFLTMMTGPDRSDYGFIPGIGISRFFYQHHGTVAEANVELVDYFSGNDE